MDTRTRIQWLPIEDVKPYENNPRKNDDAIEYVANSIREFGWQQPIVVDVDKTIIAGHTRHKAAKALGFDKVPVLVADNLTPAQVNAYRIADNSAGEAASWDMGLLAVELDGLQVDFDMADFHVPQIDIGGDWFETHERNDTRREDGNEEYNEFLDKFEAKKTTDDCYTPDLVYEAVLDWVRGEYGISEDVPIVRPFYPGGDYERESYPDGCVVVDNPPFSILAEILRFYTASGVKFFLFSPTLTLFSPRVDGVCFVPVGVAVIYENGASVNTSFTTNLEDARIHVQPSLYDAVKKANDENLKNTRKELPNYEYPSHVVTSAGMSRLAVHGVELTINRGECQQISGLDAQKELGKTIFGGGFLLSDSAAKRNEEAEKQKDENKRNKSIEEGGQMVWRLSDRELGIIADLGEGRNNG